MLPIAGGVPRPAAAAPPDPRAGSLSDVLNIVLIAIHVVVSLLLVLFILLHSGRGTGLSDVFGGGAGGMGAVGAMEKNLDRITVSAALIYAMTTILLGLRLA